MGSAYNTLSVRNGMKTTQSVLEKQQSGLDAQKKANPQEVAAQMNMDTAKSMMQGKNTIPATTDNEMAARTNQETAESMLHGEIPIVKKEEQEVAEKPKQLSYQEMFRQIYGTKEETPEQKAKREKQERTKMRIAAIGDGLRAISNMYFATQGAEVKHDPASDMTPAVRKRLKEIDTLRDTNKTKWMNGYLKAQDLDEQARKNNNNLAEQIRYHNQLAKNRERVGDQKDRSLDQSQERIDLTKLKYDTDADYKKSVLAIRQAELDGKISHWQATEAIQRMNAESGRIRANKSGSSRNGSYTGEIDEYMDLMEQDPEGMKEAEREVRKMGMSTKTAAGRKAQKLAYKKKHKGANKASSASSAGGGEAKKSNAFKKNEEKKKTGVKW